jgi:hypothetical protein
MATLPPEQLKPLATGSLKLAQIVQLVKDNQLLAAALCFISWQLGLFAQATTLVGGVC